MISDLFPQLDNTQWAILDLNEEAQKLFTKSPTPHNRLLDPEVCQKWIESLHAERGADYSWGGWMEDRSFLWRDHYHHPGRMTHLGVDYNVPAGTQVHLPYGGKLLCAEQDPDQNGGWGGRAIYEIRGLYVIFAHLSEVEGTVGRLYPAGTLIGRVGNHKTNGGWYPHLHLQCMRRYNLSVDGYGPNDEYTRIEFPDPMHL